MKSLVLIWVVLLSSIIIAIAAPLGKVVKIANGITRIDFTGDGVPDMVISGHRENNNAHSFDVVSFYVPVKDGTAATNEWNIVPIMGKKKEELTISVSGGADCLLHDFRLLIGKGKDAAVLVVADREFGDNFASEAPVTFAFYSLNHSTDQIPGVPTYSFEQSHVSKSKVKYCDVGEALLKELGLGKR